MIVKGHGLSHSKSLPGVDRGHVDEDISPGNCIASPKDEPYARVSHSFSSVRSHGLSAAVALPLTLWRINSAWARVHPALPRLRNE